MITIDELSVKMEATKLFAIWLDGFLEACGNKLNEDQTEVVRGRLNNLFHHEAEPVKNESLDNIVHSGGTGHVFENQFPGYNEPQDPNSPTIMRC
jgi:hypothetical protein